MNIVIEMLSAAPITPLLFSMYDIYRQVQCITCLAG